MTSSDHQCHTLAIPYSFAEHFEAHTGHPPFPWQEALYHDWFTQGRIPKAFDLPTGLGKTSVCAVWLIEDFPRRQRRGHIEEFASTKTGD